jgi:OOP family OmpA-OmpF porin
MKIGLLPILGLTLLLGCSDPVPPPPAPPYDPVDGMVVFFEFNGVALSRQAQHTLKQFVDLADRASPKDRIVLFGFADRVGSAEANVIISRRRADVVRTALIELGIDANRMDIRAMGDKRLVLQTPPNVREPQNRAVGICFETPIGFESGYCPRDWPKLVDH